MNFANFQFSLMMLLCATFHLSLFFFVSFLFNFTIFCCVCTLYISRFETNNVFNITPFFFVFVSIFHVDVEFYHFIFIHFCLYILQRTKHYRFQSIRSKDWNCAVHRWWDQHLRCLTKWIWMLVKLEPVNYWTRCHHHRLVKIKQLPGMTQICKSRNLCLCVDVRVCDSFHFSFLIFYFTFCSRSVHCFGYTNKKKQTNKNCTLLSHHHFY